MLASLAVAQVPVADAGQAEDVRIGVNRLNLAWLSRSDQERVLGEIAANGVTHARLSLSRPVDRSIDALEIANRLGIRILLEVQLTNKSYFPETARPRTGFGRIWDIHRLSALDLDLYRTGLRGALRRIDALGIRLEAIEPGNEINLGAYNGDLLVYPRAGDRTPRGIADLADRAAFERGLDNYLEAVRITGEEVRGTVHSRDAIIVSAGLSDLTAGEADKRGMERLDPGEVIALLRERGIDSFVDAYGIHVYPGQKSASVLADRVKGLLDFCQPSDAGKPCWVTEWGIANTARACPVDDRRREGAVRAMRAVFEQLVDAGRLTAAFYYDWDTEPSYSLWRCGRLSPAGAIAIEPTGTDAAPANDAMLHPAPAAGAVPMSP
ncbi:glycoside hydrolase [Mesorhizobium sp. CC13]|uniref:glycoside hydrolase n=1 Tax=Mesorhizobium sp. CC13 TaxID=3029194 RepID=UPI003263E237